jgi:hypothetical protein
MTRFESLLAKMYQLYKAKGSDYDGTDGGTSNLHASEAFGVDPVTAIGIRMQDKMSRFASLIRTGRGTNPAVQDEKLTDTLLDVAVYALLAIELWEAQDVNE